ncbi:TetR/AcrR family transcriptional regulator [Occultella kanbiaonis]|uniref:TetR/AcrR family transcriptional regulator n=1 Tax=Occultella kanbiaonis TaxID=2675754 RepID=UPI001E627260|nr:TetR/AcrR family transcriptional regulator [Occultella kanbiaonis]
MTTDQIERGARARTRAAILDAAAAVWARDYSASFGAIAERAEVSRSTLHRYFPDRQALVDALLLDSLNCLETVDATDTTSADPMDALEAYLRTGIEIGDRVIFLYADPDRFAENPNWPSDDSDDGLTPLLDRARAEGAIAADIPNAWAANLFYAILYTAAEVSAGDIPRHVAADLAVRSFRRSVSG